LVLLGVALAAAAEEVADPPLDRPGLVLMLRHAQAPGTGDPPGFRIGDCTTQRNLDEAGRQQARAIGDWLRSEGVSGAESRVYSSQWCRCLETAALLGLGEVTELPALNSFYERPQDRAPNLRQLQAFLRAQRADGPLIVLVTHQVTVTALTGVYPASGQGVLLALEPGAEPRVLGPISPRTP
jgi:broad specificity phosphatase PhoE